MSTSVVGGWVRWGYMRAGGTGTGLEEGVVVPKHDAVCGVRRARHPLVSAVVVRTECGEAEARAEKRSELERAPPERRGNQARSQRWWGAQQSGCLPGQARPGSLYQWSPLDRGALFGFARRGVSRIWLAVGRTPGQPPKGAAIGTSAGLPSA